MDALENLNEQIQREQASIDDLMEEIKIHVQKGQINIAKQLERDLHNSLKQLEKLHERKRLWGIIEGLNKKGVLAEAVDKIAYQA